MLHCIDRALWAVAPVVGCRPEQVWRKQVVPAPELKLLGGVPREGLELHAQLIHHSSGAVIADALRGGVRVVAGDHVRFAELAVEHKPHSVAKKRSASLREEQASSNTFTLAFSLYNVRSRSYVSGAPLGTPFDLKNSFHTISAAEKEFRRVANPARPLAERQVSAAATEVAEATFSATPASPSASDAGSLADSVASVSFGAPTAPAAAPPVAPQLEDLSARDGPATGGTPVWVQGEGLDAAALEVRFGGRVATVTAVVSAQLLKCVSPSCEMGGASEKEVSVQLCLPGAPLPATLPFTYRATKGGARPLRVDASDASLSPADMDEPALKRRVVSVLEAAADRMGGGTGGTGGGGGVTAADDAPSDEEYSVADAAMDTARAALRTRSGGVGLGHLLGALGMNRELALLLCLPGASWDERDPAGRSALQWVIARSQHIAVALLRRAEVRHGPPWASMWALSAPAVADPIAALASTSLSNVDSAKLLLEQAKRWNTPTQPNAATLDDGSLPPKTIFEVAKPGASPSPRAASIMSVIAGARSRAVPVATKAASVSDDGDLSERSTSSSSRQERMSRIAAQMAQAPAHG